MMKRKNDNSRAVYAIAGFLLGAAVFGSTAAIAAGIMAQPRTAEIVIDGQSVDLKGYLIEGSHYFQLRDIAEKLAPSGKDFGITWDGDNNRVLIDTSRPYTPEASAPQALPGEDYSQQANPAIFDWFYTREKYNEDRQRYLETGSIVNWGVNRPPQSERAIAAADNLISSLMLMTGPDKVDRINEFLCAHLTYNLNGAFSGENFWTGVTYGVCEDYGRMFQYICERVGLPCLYISGTRSPANSTGRHAWNEVYFDGRWHFYDGTLSDSRNTIVLSDTAESANTGYAYTDDSPGGTMYRKEVCVPGSTS